MVTAGTLLTDMRDRLNDAGDTQISLATKIVYMNYGMAATFPRLYLVARDITQTIASSTYEYNIPAAVGNNTKMLRVEVETGVASNRYVPLYNYEIIPSLTAPILTLEGDTLPAPVGAKIRYTAAKPLTPFTDANSVYDGPTGSEELPVLYAMGLALSRRLDDRIDHRRYPSTQNANGVGPNEIMTASQFSFAQFELLLERFAIPLPADRS